MYGRKIVLIVCILIGLIKADIQISSSATEYVSLGDKVPIQCKVDTVDSWYTNTITNIEIMLVQNSADPIVLCATNSSDAMTECVVDISEQRNNAIVKYVYTEKIQQLSSRIGIECKVSYTSCWITCSNETDISPTYYLNITQSLTARQTTRPTTAMSNLYRSTVQGISHVIGRFSGAALRIVTQTDKVYDLTDQYTTSDSDTHTTAKHEHRTSSQERTTSVSQEETTSDILASKSEINREHSFVMKQGDTEFYKSRVQTHRATSVHISIHVEDTETLTYKENDDIYVTCNLHFNETIYSYGGLVLIYQLARSGQVMYNRACPEGQEYSYAKILVGEDNCSITAATPFTHSYTFTTRLKVNQSNIDTGSFTCAGFFNKGTWFWAEIKSPPIQLAVLKNKTDDDVMARQQTEKANQNEIETQTNIVELTNEPSPPETRISDHDEPVASQPTSEKHGSEEATTEEPPVTTGLKLTPPYIKFSIAGEFDEDKQLQIGQNATISCIIHRTEKLNPDLEVDGITISSPRENGRLEGGCLKHSYNHFTKLLDIDPLAPCEISTDGNTYIWNHLLNITKDFIGTHDYQCNFRVWGPSADWFSWVYSRIISHVIMSSVNIEYSAILRPVIELKPEILSGFEGEEIEVTCSTTESYPAGNLMLRLGENEISTTEDNSEIAINIPLTKETSQGTVVCSHSAYEDVIVERKIRVMYLRHLKRRNITITSTDNKDVLVDCSTQLQISGEANYEWTGDLIRLTDKHNPTITIPYRNDLKGRQFPIKCHVTLKDDPMKRISSVDFTVVYKNHKSVLSKFTFVNFLATIGCVVAACGVVMVVFTCRELHSPIANGETTVRRPEDKVVYEGVPLLTLRDVTTQTKPKESQSKDAPTKTSQSDTCL